MTTEEYYHHYIRQQARIECGLPPIEDPEAEELEVEVDWLIDQEKDRRCEEDRYE